MTATPITTLPNRPADKPVFDFAIPAGYARVPLATVSNDGMTLVVSAWACQVDANGEAVLAAATGAPVGTTDGTNSIALSGVLAGTHTLYDGWVTYIPPSGTAIDAEHLPEGWTSGTGDPTGTPAYGTGYYDTAADKAWTYAQGELTRVAQGYADALQRQIDTATKIAALGL
ncbi:MAG TPA: hypothetical protein VFP92_10910 [Rhodanobacteraceae bacterium]|nr:hypothetical protein [Rhodanobacteraceae bacterium]